MRKSRCWSIMALKPWQGRKYENILTVLKKYSKYCIICTNDIKHDPMNYGISFNYTTKKEIHSYELDEWRLTFLIAGLMAINGFQVIFGFNIDKLQAFTRPIDVGEFISPRKIQDRRRKWSSLCLVWIACA